MVNWRRLLLIYKYRNKKKGLSQNIIFKLKTARIPTNLVWYPCRFWRAATLNWKILTDLRQPLFFVSKKTKRRSVYLLPISETATNSATNFLSAYCLYSTRHLDFYVPTDFDTIEKAFSGVKTAEKGIKQGLSRSITDSESPFSLYSVVDFCRSKVRRHRGV